MNRVVVTQAAAGFAAWLKEQGLGGGKVIVGHDARHKSDEFARDTAEVMAGAGFEVLWTDEPIPTPVVAFGIQHFGCVAGVVVTASHNPPQDNGYKVYLGDGSQIVPPTDAEIAAEIADVARGGWAVLPRSDARHDVTAELLDAYVARAASLYPAGVGPRPRVGAHRDARRRRQDGAARRRGHRPARPRRGGAAVGAQPGVPHRRVPQPRGEGRHRPGPRPRGGGACGRGDRQ